MLFLDLSNCGPSAFLRVLYFFKLILNIVFVIIPIALIILIIIDFSKAIISSDVDAQGKIFKLATKRIMYALIVFFVPTIVAIVNEALGGLGVNYLDCYTDINLDAINLLEAEEIAVDEAKKEAKKEVEKEKKEAEKDEEKIKEDIKNNSDDSSNSITTDGECDGMVYYSNGVFYKPGSSYKNGTAKTKGSANYGYNKYFYNMLKNL